MTKLNKKHCFISLMLCLMPAQSLFANEPLNEFECLHLNIGLLALLTTENTYFKRNENLQYDAKSGIGQGLSMLKERGESCSIKKIVYVEAAEYSLHFGQLENAEYFIKMARHTPVKHVPSNAE